MCIINDNFKRFYCEREGSNNEVKLVLITYICIIIVINKIIPAILWVFINTIIGKMSII